MLLLVFGCLYFSCALKLLCVKVSLYVGAASSKVSLSQHRVLIRGLVEWGSSDMNGGGWFIARNLSPHLSLHMLIFE